MTKYRKYLGWMLKPSLNIYLSAKQTSTELIHLFDQILVFFSNDFESKGTYSC